MKSTPSAVPIISEAPLAPLTTLRIGGASRYLARVSDADQLEMVVAWAERKGLPVFFLGAGSNVLFGDDGFDGLVVRNEMRGLDVEGDEVEAAGGEDLEGMIREFNRRGLAGMERMFGIPGTLAGAVVGNAGAYGQEISDSILEVEVWDRGRLVRLPKRLLDLRYRHSRFKEQRTWFLLSCRLRLKPDATGLQAISDGILETRRVKYPPELRCPGSYFKNLPLDEIPPEIAGRLPDSFIHHGKVPAGILLEAVGAKGRRLGGIRIAEYHGNLFINDADGSARDLKAIAESYAEKVQKRFGLRLEPEIRIVDGAASANLEGEERSR